MARLAHLVEGRTLEVSGQVQNWNGVSSMEWCGIWGAQVWNGVKWGAQVSGMGCPGAEWGAQVSGMGCPGAEWGAQWNGCLGGGEVARCAGVVVMACNPLASGLLWQSL